MPGRPFDEYEAEDQNLTVTPFTQLSRQLRKYGYGSAHRNRDSNRCVEKAALLPCFRLKGENAVQQRGRDYERDYDSQSEVSLYV
jgi:hypothetical protein